MIVKKKPQSKTKRYCKVTKYFSIYKIIMHTYLLLQLYDDDIGIYFCAPI